MVYSPTNVNRSVEHARQDRDLPVSILVKVRGGKVSSLQFLEDTFATARSFKAGGSWPIRADPDGGAIDV
jgi:hypothetical protein